MKIFTCLVPFMTNARPQLDPIAKAMIGSMQNILIPQAHAQLPLTTSAFSVVAPKLAHASRKQSTPRESRTDATKDANCGMNIQKSP